MVARNINPKAFQCVDIGAGRTAGDTLDIINGNSSQGKLIAASVTGGGGSPIYGGGSSWGVPIHQLHPEYKAKWDIDFDPDLAAEHLALSGVPE